MKKTTQEIARKLEIYGSDSFYAKKIYELKEVEERVAWLLRSDAYNRENLSYCIFNYWMYFDTVKAILLTESRFYADLLTPPETIRRVRQHIQNDLGFCKPQVVTQEYRAINERAMRDWARENKGRVEE